jgi:dTDP-4-dehydrorhamnose 3,5-epimerase
MTIKSVSVIELEKHLTKDIHDSHTNGELTVIWRDWDNIIKKIPKMVYVSSINPREIKGPHLHKNRTSYFSCIHGKVVFIIQDEDENFKEIEIDSEKPVLICVPNGLASAHVNVGKEQARILVLADIAWRPNDNEMINVEFTDYDFNKWK